MANIQARRNKEGKLISYSIRVYKGRNPLTGKQLKPYTMSWRVPPNWSEKTAQREAYKQAAIFEKQCKDGMTPDNRQTFMDYAEYAIGVKDRGGTKYHKRGTYKLIMSRVASEIGYMRIADIRPHHLNQLYSKLLQSGQRKGSEKVSLKIDIMTILDEKGMSMRHLARLSEMPYERVLRFCKGQKIKEEGAERIAEVLGLSAATLFNYHSDDTPLSGSTVLGHHLFISAILEQAVREMLIPYNPANRATPPRRETSKPNYFQTEDIDRILKALEYEPVKIKTLVHLFLVTGCRRSEIGGLLWSKVDWVNNQIYVDRAILYSSGMGIYEDRPKTKTSIRWIKLPDETMLLLKEYSQWQDEQKIQFGNRWHESGHIFTKEKGGPLHPTTINALLLDFAKRHSLPHINPHAFRHTQASILFFNRLDAVSISKRLGHANVSTTTDIYSHIIGQSEENIRDCVADVMLHPTKT